MPTSVTIEELRTRVLWRADAVGNPNLDASPYTLLDILINLSAKELYDEILGAFGDSYFTVRASPAINTAAGVGYINLPSDFYKLCGVSATISGDTIALERCTWNERNLYSPGESWASCGPTPRYYDKLNQIYFVPPPDAVYALVIEYVPVCPTIKVAIPPFIPAVTFDGINGWDEFIVLRTAIMILNREQSDPGPLWQELELCRKRIGEMAVSRDIGRPHKIHSVQDERNDASMLRWWRR